MLTRPIWKIPVPVKNQSRYVYSEVELRRAIGELVSRPKVLFGGQYYPSSGGEIIIADGIRVASKVVLPAEFVGIAIRSPGRYPILADGVVDTLFEVHGSLVTIEGLFVASEDTTNMFTAFVTIGASGADMTRVIDNYVVADRVYVESPTNDPNDCFVMNNVQSHINATHASPILVHGGRSRIVGNKLTDGGGDGITVGAGGDYVDISANVLRGADITTSAGDGYCTIIGNRECGTLTRNVLDSEGMNT